MCDYAQMSAKQAYKIWCGIFMRYCIKSHFMHWVVSAEACNALMNSVFVFGAEHQETVEDSIQQVQCVDDGSQSR